MWEVQKIKLYGNNSCPSELPSQHSAENLAGTKGKLDLADKSLLYENVVIIIIINIGKQLLVGLGVEDNNCMQVEDSSAHHCVGARAWPMAVLLWQLLSAIYMYIYECFILCKEKSSHIADIHKFNHYL